MKKTLSLVAIAGSIFASQSYAKDGPYVGADTLWTQAKHRFYSNSSSNTANGDVAAGSDFGAGINVGYKKSFGHAFIAPEVFYDYLNSSSKRFGHYLSSAREQDTLEVGARYGAKLNIGYNLFSKLDGFVNVGAANVKYHERLYSSGTDYGASKLAMIYGIGLAYNINDQIAIKTSYDRQVFNAKYISEGLRDRIRIDVVRLGFAYSF